MAVDRNWHSLKLGQLVTIENRVYRVVKAHPGTICDGCIFNNMNNIATDRHINCISYVPKNLHARLPVGYVFKRVRV